MKKILAIFFVCLMAVMPTVAQDMSSEPGFGVRAQGECTFMGKNEGGNLWGGQVGGFFRNFYRRSSFYSEIQLSAYYLGRGSNNDLAPLGIKEWGLSLLPMGGYNFELGGNSSIDAFFGPDLRYSLSYKNNDGMSLINEGKDRFNLRVALGARYNYKRLQASLVGNFWVLRGSERIKDNNFALAVGVGYVF